MGSAGPCPRRDRYVAVTFGIWKGGQERFSVVGTPREPENRWGLDPDQIGANPPAVLQKTTGFALPTLPDFVVWLAPAGTPVRRHLPMGRRLGRSLNWLRPRCSTERRKVMFDIMFGSLYAMLSSPHIMGLMLIAVIFGLLVGVTPGIGGKLSIAMAIPFVYGMDMVAGAVFLLTMHAVNGTSGQISSIMFGIPGDGDDAATTLDGYPLAKQGQAARALGASITASGVGGIIGAIVFAIMIPVLEPVVLMFSPAEFFLIALLGISFIAFLSERRQDRQRSDRRLLRPDALDRSAWTRYTGTPRYAGDMLFLWDGVSLVTAVLALFAVPEMIALAPRAAPSRRCRWRRNFSYQQLLSGVMEVPRHWWLVLRTSVIGAVIGMIPGLGGSAAAWLCYGHAVQSSKTPERFGKGAIEGVIAPETASNGKEGGSLLPTLFFGIPGSSGMAVLLGAFLILGIQPGATMITAAPRSRLDADLGVGRRQSDCGRHPARRLPLGRGAYLRQWPLSGAVHPRLRVARLLRQRFQWQNLIILVLFSAIGYGFLRARLAARAFRDRPRSRRQSGRVTPSGAAALGLQLLPAAALACPDRHDRLRPSPLRSGNNRGEPAHAAAIEEPRNEIPLEILQFVHDRFMLLIFIADGGDCQHAIRAGARFMPS